MKAHYQRTDYQGVYNVGYKHGIKDVLEYLNSHKDEPIDEQRILLDLLNLILMGLLGIDSRDQLL